MAVDVLSLIKHCKPLLHSTPRFSCRYHGPSPNPICDVHSTGLCSIVLPQLARMNEAYHGVASGPGGRLIMSLNVELLQAVEPSKIHPIHWKDRRFEDSSEAIRGCVECRRRLTCPRTFQALTLRAWGNSNRWEIIHNNIQWKNRNTNRRKIYSYNPAGSGTTDMYI